MEETEGETLFSQNMVWALPPLMGGGGDWASLKYGLKPYL
jgi:hypothetical protein